MQEVIGGSQCQFHLLEHFFIHSQLDWSRDLFHFDGVELLLQFLFTEVAHSQSLSEVLHICFIMENVDIHPCELGVSQKEGHCINLLKAPYLLFQHIEFSDLVKHFQVMLEVKTSNDLIVSTHLAETEHISQNHLVKAFRDHWHGPFIQQFLGISLVKLIDLILSCHEVQSLAVVIDDR